MSEKKRQKKAGGDKNRKNQATREKRPRKPAPGKVSNDADQYKGLAGTNVKSKPGVRGIV